MTDAKEAGDVTFVRLKPTPPSLEYTCARCKKPITKWTAKIRSDTKLSLIAHCHGEEAEFIVYLDMRGELFAPAPQWKRPLDDLP